MRIVGLVHPLKPFFEVAVTVVRSVAEERPVATAAISAANVTSFITKNSFSAGTRRYTAAKEV